MVQFPTVSVIIPIAPGGECEASLASIAAQDYPRERIEVLVAVGRHRSIQRNAALVQATGEIVWFMDNDVQIRDALYLQRMVAHYQDAEVASVGGPSLTPDTDSLFQRTVGQVLGSYLATQSVRARYRAIGSLRRTNERELILCSQSFRSAFIHPKGFDERLHSGNEENELMNRLDRSGRKLLYDPSLVVFRSQRATWREFFEQMGKYGKSRMEHFLIRPAAFEALFLVPLAFVAYVGTLPLVWLLPFFGVGSLWVPLAWSVPGALYVVLALASALSVAVRGKHAGMFAVALLQFFVVHFGYALGNLYGLFRRAVPEERKLPPVVVHRLTEPTLVAASRPWAAQPAVGASV